MELNFNAMLDDFLKKADKKREAEINNEIYVDEEEVEIKNQEKEKIKINLEVDNFFNSQIKDFEEKVKRTKFKSRVGYVLNNETQKIKFLLDDKAIFQIDYSDFLLNYNSEDLSEKVIKELYIMENSYTLIDFVEKNCYISENILPSRFRISYKVFVSYYINWTEEKYGANKLVNMKKISKILKRCFDCEKIKYENEWQLNKITSLKIYKEQSEKNSNYTSDEEKVFSDFINEFCEISDYIEPLERIKKSDFRKVYNAYLKNRNLINFKLKNNELKDILLKKYKESFIKSNGIWYMKKIKFKNFK